MVKSFQNVEPVPLPTMIAQESMEELAGRQMLPSIRREIPFKVVDLQDDKLDPSQFESLAELFRHRASNSQGRIIPAFTLVDHRGKEITSLTWEKLSARAEKVAMVIRDKSGLQVGDRIALSYRRSEMIDFIVALIGCFLAGMVAVPINSTDELSELWFILRVTNVHLVLTTDGNLKALTKMLKAKNVDFPKDVDWWPTNDFGSLYAHQLKTGKYSPVRSTPLAYIEFTKSINGELKGVAVSHQSIMRTCHTFTAATTDTVVSVAPDGTASVLPNWDTQGADTILTYLEPRQQLGLNVSVLCSIYNGSHTVFASPVVVETPAVWIYLVSKYNVTIGLANYPGIYYTAKYYQRNPKEVSNYSKKVTPDLSSLRILFIDSLVVKPDMNTFIADHLLAPLGQKLLQSPIEVVTPIASLPEHAGMIVGFRDYLGPSKLEEYEQEQGTKRTIFASGKSRDVWECVLDANELRRKKVVVLATAESAAIYREEEKDEPGYVKVGSHGFPFPTSSVAIVDPETNLLCPSDTVGEIWMDMLSPPEGFWGIPALNDLVYRASPMIVPPETLYPENLHQQFVRTGLLGTIIGGRLIVLGPYEECIRQQRLDEQLGAEEIHMISDLLSTISKRCKLEACTIFSIYVNRQHLPVLALESANEDATKQVEQAINALLSFHGLRVFAAIVTGKGVLPRYSKDGHSTVHHLLTKRQFLSGQLPIQFIKMDVDRTVFSDAASFDTRSSVWQTCMAAYERALGLKVISPRARPQHSGIEMIQNAIDERSNYDLSRFRNMVDIMLWRTSLYPEENAFVLVTQSSTKPISWRKINNQIATIANYMGKKLSIKPGTKVMILMPFGIDLVRSIYACFVLGLVPVICSPPDTTQTLSKRIQEDVTMMLNAVEDISITHIIVNSQSEDLVRSKIVHAAVKHAVQHGQTKLKRLPDHIVNIDKAPRFNKLLGPESGYSVRSEWTSDKSRPALVMIHPTVNELKQQYVVYGHDTIVAQCRAQKLTCQIRYQRPLIVTGIGGLDGLGLLHAVFCGVYVGCTTILMPAIEFKENPVAYFELLSRNKCSTVCANYMLFDQAINRINPAEQKQISLQNTQNFMLTVASRTKPRFYEKISRFLSLSGLERETINSVYSHAYNPMITTRSYMLIEPISLIADFEWLRQGIVRPLSQTDEAYGVLLHDSGIVPTNTMVAIVNPETLSLCPTHVIGEIWVSSDSNVKGLYPVSNTTQFEATIQGADPRIKYMRTGDVGFLWNVQRQAMSGSVEEGQCLYILGHMGEMIMSKGLLHFAVDIEESVETCHPNIWSEGCYIIQMGLEIIVVVAVKSSSSALSTIPLIVSAILERHALLIDTVVIITKDQLPKKYNGEKRRKRILSMYMNKELSAIHVCRIKNQHQPIHLPKWNSVASNLGDDSASVISFGQTSHVNFDTESASMYRSFIPASTRSRNSNGAESITSSNALQS
ncbi:acetyl-CoA synthetase-like protein [Rhizopus microsporus var. microsporus]|nr:acetyl-CoA synthetase-like protein [Rhizopus microsporus var. microsporus]